MNKTDQAGEWFELYPDRELIERLETALIRLDGSPWSRLESVVSFLESAAKAGEALDELLSWRAGDPAVYNLEHLENLAFSIEDAAESGDEVAPVLEPDSLFFFAPRFLAYIRDLARFAQAGDASAQRLLMWFIPHEPRGERGRPRVSFSERNFRVQILETRRRARQIASGHEAALQWCKRVYPKIHEALSNHRPLGDREGTVLALTYALWQGRTDSIRDMNEWLGSQEAEDLRKLLEQAEETTGSVRSCPPPV